jgi:hypothetical protein
LLAAAVGLALAGPAEAAAQNRIDKLVDDLEAEKARFVKDKEAAKQRVLSQFDTLIRKVVNSPKLKAADRLSLADRLRSEREAFAKTEDLPENSDVVEFGWAYGTTLVRKYHALSQKFDQAISACIRDGDRKRAEKIKADKEKFDDEHFPGRKHFAAGAQFAGSRYTGTSAALFRFGVSELRGGVFKARAEQNLQVGGHPISDIGGSLDGIHVTCNSLKNIQGGMSLARCEGVLLGETLILELITVAPRTGQATKSYAVLRKK